LKVSIVTFFVEYDAVAALRGTASPRAIGFTNAGSRTAIAWNIGAIITSFRALYDTISASGGATACLITLISQFFLAVFGTTISVFSSTVITLLGKNNDAITTFSHSVTYGEARFVRITDEATLDIEAVGPAAISGDVVAVIADLFFWIQYPIATTLSRCSSLVGFAFCSASKGEGTRVVQPF
jgi:hypothetical protein